MAKHDLAADTETQIRDYKRSFILSSKQWKSFTHTARLSWNSVPFNASSRPLVANDPGVYAFAIRHECRWLPPHGYIIYFGITGSNSPNRTLRIRFSEYLLARDSGSRLIDRWLKKWKDDVDFHFTLVDRRFRLEKLEAALLGAVIPPCNVNDFSGVLKIAVKDVWR